MKTSTLIVLLLLNLNALGQNSIFGKYDFNKKKYALYCTLWWAEPQTEFSKSMLNFYIDDLTVLNELKKEWEVKEGFGAACGYDYNLYLVEADSVVEHWLLNIECNFLEMEGVFFQIDSSQISILCKRSKPLIKNGNTFSSLDSARSLFNRLKSNDCTFIPPRFQDEWINFHGVTKFERGFSIKGNINHDSLCAIIEQEIASELLKYKTKCKTVILLSSDGLGEVNYRVWIYTNKPLNSNSIQNYELKEDWMVFNEIEIEYYNKKNCP